MTYYVRYWIEDEETVVTAEELATALETATAQHQYLELTEITATEMHFTIFEIEE